MNPSLCFTIALVAVACIGLSTAGAAAPSGDYSLQPGPRKVRSANGLVLHDAKRDKDLQLRVNHPEGNGPCPVIVWSHGAYGSKDNYQPLTEHWASYGYATIQANHSDSRSLGMKLGNPKAFGDWRSRPTDVSFILDSLAEIERQAPALRGKLDRQRIGVGGHSFGANTAQLTGGATTRELDGRKSYQDKRVRAVMLLSGQGPGEMLTETSWERFTTPMLVMSGSNDGPTRTGQPAEWRKKPYELSPAGDKYLIWIEGLDHGYGGITGVNFSGRNKLNPDHVNLTKLATLVFWDAYLKDSAEAKTWLKSDKLPELSKGALRLQYK